MTALTDKQIDEMSKGDLAKACKVRGIKYGKMSLLQQREELKKNKAEPAPKEKKARVKADGPRPGSKMEKAVTIFKENKGKERKEILKLFMDRVKLTQAGANTYYATIKKKIEEAKS
jgi:hypothetical protein